MNPGIGREVPRQDRTLDDPLAGAALACRLHLDVPEDELFDRDVCKSVNLDPGKALLAWGELDHQHNGGRTEF